MRAEQSYKRNKNAAASRENVEDSGIVLPGDTCSAQQEPVVGFVRATVSPAGLWPAGDPDCNCMGGNEFRPCKVLLRKTLVRRDRRPICDGSRQASGSAQQEFIVGFI